MDISPELRSLETALLSPEVRRDPAQVGALLAEEFEEFGASGRVWTRSEILIALAAEESEAITLHDFACRQLSPTTALVTYRSCHNTLRALRSSIWVRRGGNWQMIFHQGTRVPAV